MLPACDNATQRGLAAMPFDLFISYSRRDNEQGRVTDLTQQIEADYRAFAEEDLRCFFDLEDTRRQCFSGNRHPESVRCRVPMEHEISEGNTRWESA
jgi:hypothetical protein